MTEFEYSFESAVRLIGRKLWRDQFLTDLAAEQEESEQK